jgi:DNA-binding CsgD family transcriptional regulator
MQQLIPLYLILSILPGIAALTVLGILVSRFKNRGLIYYFIAYGCFSINMLVNLVMFYFGINISKELSFGIFALLSFNIPVSVLMHTALPLAVNEIAKPPGKRWIDIIIISVAVIELIIYWTPLVMQFSRETQTIIFGPVFPFVSVKQVIFIAYSIGIIIIRRKTLTNLMLRRYILTMAAILAVFFPAIIYDEFLFSGFKIIDTVPIAVTLSPLLYIILSLVTLFFGIRVMTYFSNRGKPTDSQDAILKNLAERSGLSVSEITIIPLMAKGLGNKQIALELHISPKTVGNHIYNIYRKLDITNRYELLALLK